MKRVSIKVSNAELEGLEDYLTVDYDGSRLSEIEEEQDRQDGLRIWMRLVKAFDRETPRGKK